MFNFGNGSRDSSIFSGAEILEVKLERNYMQKRKLMHLL